MGWQEDLARTNDPWLRRPATTSKKSSSEKRAERKERNVYNETLRRAQSGDKSDYVKRQLGTYGLNLDTAKDASFRGSLPDLRETFKPVTAMFADFIGQGLGAYMQGEKARVGGKFNAPLNVKYGTPAYKWLLEDVIKDEDDQDDFRREVAKGNLSWTELNKYADPEYIGGGQLARGINARNEGITGTDTASEVLNEVLQEKEGDTPAIKNTIANYRDEILRDLDAGYRRNAPVWNEYVPPMTTLNTPVTREDLFDEPYGEEWDIDTSPYRLPISRQGPLDTSPETQELLMDLYTDPFHGDPYYREGHIPTIDERAGTGYTDYRGVNPFREPYLPMEGPSPVPLPPYLSADTDWWTPEPEEEDLRGWDWLNEPVMRHYGAGRPSEEIEREWPNTPPPGYESPPSWYQKYLDQFGFNTGYDYYNE